MSIAYHIIANLQSGSGKGKKFALAAEDFFHKQDLPYYLYQTEYRGHASSLAQKVVKELVEEDRLLVIGGDGTLHEVIAGLKEVDNTTPIGYVPAGTGNDFARSIGLPRTVKKSLALITGAETPTTIECLVYHNDKKDTFGVALNSFGLGFDGKVIEVMDQKEKRNGFLSKIGLKKGEYISTLIDAFKNRQALDAAITVDGKRQAFHNVLVAGVMNHPYFGGGIKIDPQSSQNNHELAIMIIYNLPSMQLLRLLPKAITTGGHIHSPYFERISGKEASIELFTPSVGQVDGEPLPEDNYHIHFRLSSFNMWK